MDDLRVEILLDSISPTGHRLTTFNLKYPRIIHAELMTHRIFSRNASSSRAIPVEKLLEESNFTPWHWTRNQPGMQGYQYLTKAETTKAKRVWESAKREAFKRAIKLMEMGVHKSIPNRLLEPFGYISVILSGTSFKNFFDLRVHEAAEPHMRDLATRMQEEYEASQPVPRQYGEWHTPFLQPSDDSLTIQERLKVSTARCARVSYLNHMGKREVEKDYQLHDNLLSNRHMSPFEHCARASWLGSSNFTGWESYRYLVEERREIV